MLAFLSASTTFGMHVECMLLLIRQPLVFVKLATAAEGRQEEVDNDKEVRHEYNRVSSILQTWRGDYSFSIGGERVFNPSSAFQNKEGRIKGRCRAKDSLERQTVDKRKENHNVTQVHDTIEGC
jgi:hypothetical protein